MKKIGFSAFVLALVSLSGSNMQAAGGDFAEQQAKSGCPTTADLMRDLMRLQQAMASLATTEYFIAQEGAFKASLQAAMVVVANSSKEGFRP